MDDFAPLINKWFRQNKRNLPWRETKNPYNIWLSEIILQQTRVDQGLNYYLKFIKHYPTVVDLANADEKDVLNDWQGLGYYSRARNLHASAKSIRDNMKGVFPHDYSDILSLKGVGKYTASAIASIAFNLPYAVVDGNVYRVLSRLYDINTPIDSSAGKKQFQEIADQLIDKKNPGDYNQAIMEFGALICTPQPKCTDCPVVSMCHALKNKTIALRPVKTKKTKVRDRYLHFMIYYDGDHTLLEHRDKKDIWQNMYQFPLIETSSADPAEIEPYITDQSKTSKEIIHLLSHQKLHVWFHHIDRLPSTLKPQWLKLKLEAIQDYPLPRVIDKYLEEESID